MSKKAKRIIAREVLFLFGTAIIIGVLILYVIYSDNQHKKEIDNWENVSDVLKNKYDSLTNEDSLPKRPFVARIQWVIENKNIDKKFSVSDSIFYFEKILDRKFTEQLYSEFQHKLETFKITRDDFDSRINSSVKNGQNYFHLLTSIRYARLEVNDKLKIERQRRSDLNDLSQVIAIIIVAVAYPARILFYLIRWSINTLKEVD